MSTALYNEIMEVLRGDGGVGGLVLLFEENELFVESCTDEIYDGVQYKIPLEEWNDATGMNVDYLVGPITEMNDLIAAYEGSIDVDVEGGEYFVCLRGSA